MPKQQGVSWSQFKLVDVKDREHSWIVKGICNSQYMYFIEFQLHFILGLFLIILLRHFSSFSDFHFPIYIVLLFTIPFIIIILYFIFYGIFILLSLLKTSLWT
jgi:ABC-type amino acid transport system permease subunit